MSRGVSRPTLVHAPYAEDSWALAPGLECGAWPSPHIYRLGFLLASPREGFTDDAGKLRFKGY